MGKPDPSVVSSISLSIHGCRKRTMENRQIIHIIDDDKAVRKAIGLLLSIEGFKARTFASAPAFLATIKGNARGCVVTDIDMPTMTGIELLANIAERRLALPVIVMTGDRNVSLAVLAMKKGALEVLEKPFSVDALLSAVAKAMAPSTGPAAVAV